MKKNYVTENCQQNVSTHLRRARGGADAAHFGGKMKIGQKYDFWAKPKKPKKSIFWTNFVLRCTLRTAFLVYFQKNFRAEVGAQRPPLRTPPVAGRAPKKSVIFFEKKWT